jgi:hypothetical protein
LLSFSWEKNILIEEGSEKKSTSTMKIPAPKINKWLLPNKVIGTKLQLLPVVEVCRYCRSTPFSFPWIAFYIKYSDSCYLCVCWNLTAKRRYNDYILYQDDICSWLSSNFVCPAILNFEIISLVIRSFEWFHTCKR